MSWIPEKLSKLKTRAQTRAQSSEEGRKFWEALVEALDVVEQRQEEIRGIGQEAFNELLRHWANEDPLPKQLEAIARASAKELTMALRVGTAALEQATQKQREREAALLEVGKKLGAIGARFLLHVIL